MRTAEDPAKWIARLTLPLDNGCHQWLGYVNPITGYGECTRLGQRQAHRAVYVALVGPIPAGLDLDHLCRNRSCVNPEHLQPVTRSTNLLRSPLVGRGRWAS